MKVKKHNLIQDDCLEIKADYQENYLDIFITKRPSENDLININGNSPTITTAEDNLRVLGISSEKAREGILSFVRLLAENDALEHSKTNPGTEG
ncbi:MAG: hypothetical protein HOF98_09100 [Gammaproteobacteria bacterium]|jgi:hypothetical protein|nr:hypothetical protein [Gammaproteobacteria bacterium]